MYTSKTLKLQERQKCALTGTTQVFDRLYTLENFPVICACIRQLQLKDIFITNYISVSRPYGVIQFSHLVPDNFNYAIPHNSGIIGDIWKEHHKKFAKFLYKFQPKSVLEIGGGHGILSTYFKDIPWYNVDPAGVDNKDSNAIFIKEFFNETFQPTFEYDTIVHSHTIEHMSDIEDFVKSLSCKTQIGQYVIFSMPNLMEMFKRNYTNSLTLEHTVIIEEDILEYIFNKFKFKLEDKEYFKEAHSIFYCFKRSNEPINNNPPVERYQINRKLVDGFIKNNEEICKNINNNIKDVNKNIYIFGAHVFTQYLINFGLNVQKINGILDNDSGKIGKRLYGTSLYVHSPTILSSIQNAVVILYAGSYTEEIKQQLYSINKNVTVLSYENRDC